MNFLVGILVGCILCGIIITIQWEHHDTIVNHNCAQYNSKTGNFEWIKNE